MPAAIHYSHKILKSLSDARHSGELGDKLGPDAKTQITLHYHDGQPVGADAIVLSTQHKEGLSQKEVRDIVKPYIERALPKGWMCKEEKLLVNPTGSFVIGGPDGDCGLTGRKIIVDTYGGAAPHGGGAFSGKDPTKVDRSAAYAARYLAKNVVAAGLAEECTIQIAYAIGVSSPVAFYVSTHDTGKVDENSLSEVLQELMDLTPHGIRTHLKLNRPIYEKTAAYGHFGRAVEKASGHFSWEETNLVDALQKRFASVDTKYKQTVAV
jgi:S-adenosylmethionine synthetase